MSNASRSTPLDTVVDLVAATARRRPPTVVRHDPSLLQRIARAVKAVYLPDYASRHASNDPACVGQDLLRRYY